MHRDKDKIGQLMDELLESDRIARRFRFLERRYTRHALTLRRKLMNRINNYWTFPWEFGSDWNASFGAARFMY